MERYNSYKDSGVKWLGEIPSHWEMRKMKFAFDERSEKGYPSLPLLAATQNHGVIRKEEYENRTVEATKSLESLKLVDVGDFVISLRSFQGGIEISYDKGIISPAYTVLRPTHISGCYFKHLGKSPIFIQLLKSMVTGIREGQNIDYVKLRENLLPIPPLDEQSAIAAYLDTATAKIDAAIAQQQKMIDLLNECKQIIINRAVTKGLNPNAKMKDSGVEWIGEVPEDWKVRKLKYLVSCNDETLSENEDKYLKIKYVEIGDVDSVNGVKHYTEYSFEDAPSRARRITQIGDVIVSTVRTYLKAVSKIEEENLIVSTGFAVLRANSTIDKDYLAYSLLSECFVNKVISESDGTSYPAINASDLIDIKVALPPITEQLHIVLEIKKKIKVINGIINKYNKQISLLQERKQIIINEVVTGKVRVV